MNGEIFSAFSILFIMLGLLGLAAWAIRRFGLIPGQPKVRGNSREIKIIENQMLDARNRLMVVNWRGKDYLLGSGQNGLNVIDQAEEGNSSKSFQQTLAGEQS